MQIPGGQEGHDVLFWEIVFFCVPILVALGGILFMVRLMWKDYKKRHDINGEDE